MATGASWRAADHRGQRAEPRSEQDGDRQRDDAAEQQRRDRAERQRSSRRSRRRRTRRRGRGAATETRCHVVRGSCAGAARLIVYSRAYAGADRGRRSRDRRDPRADAAALDYTTTLVGDGAQAWDHLRVATEPTLAILDWMMPEMDGPDVCRRVRAELPLANMYLLLVTAREGRGDVVAGLDAGADDYIIKPFDPDELRARVAVGVRVLGLQQKLAERVAELQDALSNVKQLHGLLPICSYCKRIRGDDQDLAAGRRLHRRAFRRAVQPRHLPGVLRDGLGGARRDVAGERCSRRESTLVIAETGWRRTALHDLARERQADAAGRDRRPGISRPSGRSRRCRAASSASAAPRRAWPTGSVARSTPGMVISCAPFVELQPLRLIDFLDRRVDRQARQRRAFRSSVVAAPSACRRASARCAIRDRG